MTNRINSYNDLLEEQERLRALLKVQKEVIRQDFREIKQDLAPVKKAFSFIGKLTTRETGNPLLTGTANTVIDLVIRRFLLARSGWLIKLLVPALVKNYSSHVIDDNKNSILRKILSFFGKGKKKNGPEKPETGAEPQNSPLK